MATDPTDSLDLAALGLDESTDPQPVYRDVEHWVTEWLSPIIRRRLAGTSTTWCAQYYEHQEALARLAALWAAWETTHLQGGESPSMWWVHHFDPQWARLSATDGPFSACKADRHTSDPEPLPIKERP